MFSVSSRRRMTDGGKFVFIRNKEDPGESRDFFIVILGCAREDMRTGWALKMLDLCPYAMDLSGAAVHIWGR